MNIEAFCEWLQNTSYGQLISGNAYLFPTVESIHVLAITLVVGSIFIVDLRLLGIASTKRPVSQLMHEVLPLTWIAFIVAFLTGSTLFISAATRYLHNFPFKMKMVLLLVAGLNMAFFHLFTARGIDKWDHAPRTPPSAKLAGALSVALWIAIVAFGRWIGFTESF